MLNDVRISYTQVVFKDKIPFIRTFAFKIPDGSSASLTLTLIQNDSSFLLLVLSYKVDDYPALLCQSNGHPLPRRQRHRKPHTAGPLPEGPQTPSLSYAVGGPRASHGILQPFREETKHPYLAWWETGQRGAADGARRAEGCRGRSRTQRPVPMCLLGPC